MVGDTTDAVWGVMDMYPRTNFPDIRRKVTVHSEAGSLLVIPREGGSLVRFYIEFPSGTNVRDVRLEDLHDKARQIFSPYSMEFSETYWWSCYCVGQRLADHFTKANRVFLTGDAFHTHSPKAGQGMNVSLQDGYNIGWKLGMVLTGKAAPELLTTYDVERGKTAADLIDFDRFFMKLFSMKGQKESKMTPEQFSQGFIKSGRYTAGLTAKYEDSALTSTAGSTQAVAENIVVGMRFPSAQVVRFCDAKAMQLARALKADGRWRVVFFAGRVGDPNMLPRLEKVRPTPCPRLRIATDIECTDCQISRFPRESRTEIYLAIGRHRQLHRTDRGARRRASQTGARGDSSVLLAGHREVANPG